MGQPGVPLGKDKQKSEEIFHIQINKQTKKTTMLIFSTYNNVYKDNLQDISISYPKLQNRKSYFIILLNQL